MSTVTKKDLIDRIANNAGLRRADVKRVVQDFLDEVINELADGNRLEFRDFGVFETKERAPRTAQNPKTLEPVEVPAKKTVKFKVGRLMRESLEPKAESTGVVVHHDGHATDHLERSNGHVGGHVNGVAEIHTKPIDASRLPA